MTVRDRFNAGEYTTKMQWPMGQVMSGDLHAEQRKAYNRDQARLYEALKNDVFAENKVSGPKAEKAWNIAYEQFHSYGYEAIVDFFEELCELIK